MARRKGLVINDRQLDRCDDLLQKLKEVSGSSFLALISTSGQPITTASDEYHPETLSLASLAASSFAATQQLAKILDENEFTLLFHEGKGLEPPRLPGHRPGPAHRHLRARDAGGQGAPVHAARHRGPAADLRGPDDEAMPEMDADFEAAAGTAMDDLFKDM